jgi:hypothetical protein
MVGYPFFFNGKEYYYTTGQGMGAYSSWASMALCHHLIVRAAKTYGCQGSYALLGDDIVITGSKFGRYYRYLIKCLGVQISKPKSYRSKDLYEFAKRQVYKGIEVTGAPLHGLFTTMRRYHLFMEQINQMEARILKPGISMVTRASLYDFYTKVGKPDEFALRLATKAYRFYLLPRKGEDPNLFVDKYARIGFDLLPEVGCNASPISNKFRVVSMLMVVKSKMIEKGLIETVKSYNSFIWKLQDIADSSGGAVALPLLQEIPAVRCYIQNVRDIQAEFDQVRTQIWNNLDDEVLFNKELTLGLNPLAVFSLRPHENILANNAWLLKELDKWMPGYFEGLGLALTADPSELPDEETINRIFGPAVQVRTPGTR